LSQPVSGFDSTRPANTPAHAANDTSAKDQAKDVAQTGKQAAGEVAQTATNAAKDVAGETKERAADLYAQTKSQLGDQVVSQKGALVEGLRSLGDQLAAMTDHVEESGTAVDVASKARDQARTAAEWLDSHEPNQVVDELRSLGRQQPGRFLLGALLAGVVAGRLTRGVVAVHTDDSDEGTSPATQQNAVATPAVAPAIGTPAVSPAGYTPGSGFGR